MGRVKRGYTREIPLNKLKWNYHLFTIACEWSKKAYFQQFEWVSHRGIVEYIEDERYRTDSISSPSYVLWRGLEYMKNDVMNDKSGVWLIMDMDKCGTNHWMVSTMNDRNIPRGICHRIHVLKSGCYIILRLVWRASELPQVKHVKSRYIPKALKSMIHKDTLS